MMVIEEQKPHVIYRGSSDCEINNIRAATEHG